jgi:hypothetical protein
MPTPKSQVKVLTKQGKTEIQYESNLDASEYYIFELTRAALRDVGKFITKAFKAAYYQRFDKHSGKAGKATKYKVISGQNTKYPRVQIGLRASDKADGFYAYFQELGTSTGIPRLGLLQKTVKDNVAEIVKIESQYLDGLNGEAERLEKEINEKDYEGDADGDK